MSLSQQSALCIPLSPQSLTKLSTGDALQLYEYIVTIQKENKSRNEERKFMEKYINDIKQQMDDLINGSKNWKGKELYFQAQLYRLSHQCVRLGDEVKVKEERIGMLEAEVERMSGVCMMSMHKKQQIQKSHRQQLSHIIQQHNTTISQLTQTHHKSQTQQNLQISTLSSNLHNLQQQHTQLVQIYSQLQQKYTSLQQQYQQIVHQVTRFKSQKQIDDVREREWRSMREVEGREMGRLERDLGEKCEELVRQRQERSRVQVQLQTLKQEYLTNSTQWQQRYTTLQQFLSYIKQTILQQSLTIQSQQSQINILEQSNKKLRKQILQNIQKLNIQSQKQKDKQLRILRQQLAVCKGKLAEQDRKLSYNYSGKCLYSGNGTPSVGVGVGVGVGAGEYMVRLRLGTEETEEDRNSVTYSQKQCKTKSIMRIRDFQTQNTNFNH